jgi:hypothetical protein
VTTTGNELVFATGIAVFATPDRKTLEFMADAVRDGKLVSAASCHSARRPKLKPPPRRWYREGLAGGLI